MQDGNIPLFLAVEAGNHGVCRDLLGAMTREQVSYVHPSTGNTALHLAARRRDLDIMRFLVECQSPVNQQNAEGQTPLHVAAREGDEQAVKLFHHAGANPNLIDSEDRTPLHIATQLGHVGVVELLIDKYKASVLHRTKVAPPQRLAGWLMPPSCTQCEIGGPCRVLPSPPGHASQRTAVPETTTLWIHMC